ncbi:ATP-binding protein [Streptomyces kaniharaensis]|uniref:ATP-binding protein n=1 Tax=Streptomyces kaniharaensis TaxID=212423 RepID=A0A6N7KKB0_9ACTN|nr:ATP-binding protein [Streptomyces kaniharaensis]MQS11195.1 ATP-binding protein [Streptomyces kaniharaensis]
MSMVVSPLSVARFPVPLEWGVPPGVDAVPAARRLVVAIVREWGVPLSADALQEVEACASELIANALVHTKERCAVTVRRRAGRLRVEVADRCPELPRQERDDESTSGRGLLLVEALAHAWGWHPAGVGKVVWFEYLEASEAPCPTHGWGTARSLHSLCEVA